MPDGELSTDGAESSIAPKAKASSTPSPIVKIRKEVEAKMEKKEKDPRKIARKYQLELCKKATEENIIVYLETGCGKTHIAVLLIYELGHLIRKPQKRICIFLAPTVALAQQQARVIEDSLDFKVGIFSGNCRHLKNHHDWAKEIEQYEVLVMTPQILLRSLYHCFIRMNLIALLIFDECHHAQIKSNHPYAEIMKVFYDKASASMLPRIFGMTASPVVGKGASSQVNLPKSINSLENLLDAKVYSVGDKEELESFVATPVVRVYDYGPVSVGPSSPYVIYCSKLEEIRRQCISTLVRKNGDFQSVRNTKKLLNRMHDNIIFCLENLGLWGALQACQLLLTGNNSERSDLIEDEGISSDDSVCDRYLAQADDVFASDCKRDGSAHDLSDVEILKEPFFSKKLLRLVGILSTFRVQPNMKCIIFVNRIVTARSLSYILQNLKFLLSWKCHFLVGVHSGLKSMSRRTMNSILEKFRTGELNLLVATKVGEEGLDIQTCCLVIRFDLPETVASFIQSRGRARMPLSEYAFLVNSGNERELNLINNFKKDEDRMNMEITYRTSTEVSVSLEERMYTVPSSGASISSGYSVSLLHQYCSKLPHDEYFHPKPSFYYFDDTGGTICNIILPSNAPINQISSTPQSSVNAAKKDACLKAIEELHKLGALSDHLLPLQSSVLEEEMVLLSSDSENSEDEDTRGELHEMLVPAALKEPWTNLENYVLYSYYIKFIPNPEDRSYKEFALFVKSPLPEEAERMELDLHLARHRSVMTELIPSGVAEFKREEIMEAQHFQVMFFKVILDRSKLLSEFVPLGNDFLSSSSSTFYLLLPVIPSSCDGKMTVDWGIVQRCLSSPLFRTPEEAAKNENFPSDVCLQLVNGCTRIRDIENSLVYATHKEAFYFITNIVGEKNGYSPYRDSGTLNHVEHLKMSNIHLKYPEQPLLHAKPLFKLHNLLHNRKQQDSESHELEEYFIDLPPELCQLKIIGFSKDIGSSLSLLPSIMHRLENLLVAIELKHVFSASFAEGVEVTANRVLEALTTEKCQERFSLERLETLGDSFLKFAVGRHLFLLHDALDEGQLTGRRSNVVNNSNLLKLATRRNLQVYIRDQPFDPCQFFALGHPCPVICTKETNGNVSQHGCQVDHANSGVRCSRNHHWLHKKTIADVVEALVGAFIVDSGFQAATAFLRWIGIRVDFQGPQVNSICAASKRFMPLSSQVDTVALEKLLGYRFLHKGLLFQAFVHPSYNRHGGGCFQRLEFLGDAVLDFLITSYLFSLYPNLKPGQLTDLRSVAVNNTSFANVAVEKCLHEFLIADSRPLNEAIEKYVSFFTSSPDRGLFEGPKCPKALGDLVEACFGAILLDTGFNLNHVWKIMLSLLDPIKSLSSVQLNPVREVTELCTSRNWDLKFETSQSGKNFLVDGRVNGGDVPVSVSAISTNKKHATRTAAHELYVKLKALGYAPKSKSLEEFLKGSCKGEAKLIGFDETPIDVDVPDITEFKNMKLQESLVNDSKPETCSINKTTTSTDSPCISPISRQPHSSQAKAGCSASSVKVKGTLSNCSNVETSCGIDSQSKGESQNRTARSQLYETCAINCWKPPLFECSNDEGPSHLRSFTYKVIIEIEDAPDMILECFSSPRTTKKAAAEHAAEGALWYLKHEGYLQ